MRLQTRMIALAGAAALALTACGGGGTTTGTGQGTGGAANDLVAAAQQLVETVGFTSIMAGFIDSSMTLTLDGITPNGPQSWVGGVDGKPLETGDGESMSGLVLDVATPAADID